MMVGQLASGRRATFIWAIAFCLAMAGAGLAVARLHLGWFGSLGVMLLATAMIVPFVWAIERVARSKGDLSPAMQRYNRRMILGSMVYTLGLFTATFGYKTLHPDGALLWLLGLLPSVGVLLMVWAMGRLLVEENDEYLRLTLTQSALLGTGALLVVATLWGFLEQFGVVPHVPSWAALPVFAVAIGLSRCISWLRA
jgi:hypothetical protein